MATKTQHNPTANLFSLLQNQADEKEHDSPAAPKPTGAMTPAEKARIRQAAQAEKDAALKVQQEADKERKEAEAAFNALVGPLEGFQTQKTAKKDTKAVEKKKGREEFEKYSPGQGRKYDGEKKPYTGEKKPYTGEKKPYTGEKKPFTGEKKPYDPNQKRQYSDGEKKPFSRDPEKKHAPGHTEQHHGNKPPKRDFDKHSAGKTGRHFESKRGGDGGANWGNPVKDGQEQVAAGSSGWGNDTEPKTETTEAVAGWGDENEEKKPKTEEEEKKVDEPKEPAAPAKPSWDDEGFGKMTLQEYQAKVAAAKAAELAEKVGVAAPRKIENVDLSKFVEKDTSDDKYAKKVEKKDKKKVVGPSRSGEKPVELGTVFDVNGRGGRGGRGRGGAGRGAQPQRVNPKQFPDLVQANKPGAK